MSQSPAYFAVRTLRALEVLAFTPGTAPQIADALGVHPRTARRLLGQLQRDGWLSYSTQSPRIYSPTLRFVALAAHVGAGAPLATLTAPALERLHRDTGLDVSLAIPSYRATVCLLACCGKHVAHFPLGTIIPAHCSAPGKVLMAHREAWRSSILESAPLERVEPLARELARIRLDGYALDDGESDDRCRQLAAPVSGPGGEVLAAVAVRLDALPRRALMDRVCAAGRAASDALAEGAKRYPLHRGIVYRLLGSYGLARVDAYI